MSSTTPHGSRHLDLAGLQAAMVPNPPLMPDDNARDLHSACRQLKSRCGFPVRHLDAIMAGGIPLDQPRQDALDRLAVAIRDRGLILLWGDRGVGKTHIATMAGAGWWCYGYYAQYGACRYWRVTDLMSDQRKWFGNKMGPYGPVAEPFEVAADCGLLVLDEINEIRQDSNFDMDAIVRTIDARYAGMRPTVLITNLKPQGFAKVLGGSVVDRIKDRGAVIECNWNNYRDVIRKGGA